MQQVASKIRIFTDLNAWQISHELVLNIYSRTNEFPEEEKFGLARQMRRAAVSITSNLAEGFARFTQNDKKHFYIVSHASLTELQNQLLIARDVGYLDSKSFRDLSNKAVSAHKTINGLIKSLGAAA